MSLLEGRSRNRPWGLPVAAPGCSRSMSEICCCWVSTRASTETPKPRVSSWPAFARYSSIISVGHLILLPCSPPLAHRGARVPPAGPRCCDRGHCGRSALPHSRPPRKSPIPRSLWQAPFLPRFPFLPLPPSLQHSFSFFSSSPATSPSLPPFPPMSALLLCQCLEARFL